MHIPKLQPGTPHFDIPKETKRECDVPSCIAHGEYKAPKSKTENPDFFFFCIDHVREYNQNWNYFDGMSDEEVEQHMIRSMTWDRPTWQSNLTNLSADQIRRKVYRNFRDTGAGYTSFDEKDAKEEPKQKQSYTPQHQVQTPEMEALAILGISPPTSLAEIRETYRKLVKKYHPDLNIGCKKSEEQSKKINMAYSVLKIAYQKFETFDK